MKLLNMPVFFVALFSGIFLFSMGYIIHICLHSKPIYSTSQRLEILETKMDIIIEEIRKINKNKND